MASVEQQVLSRGEGSRKETQLHPSFLHNTFEMRRRFLRIGTTFDITDEGGNFLMRAKKEPFHLTKRFHLSEDKEGKNELLSFKTRGSIPETYDIKDASKAESLGSVRHNIPKSFPRTSWDILSPKGEVVGTLRRMKVNKAWHRYGPKVLFYPSYEIVTPDGNVVSSIQRKFSPLGLKFKMDIQDTNPTVDRRLLVAANIIIAEREFVRQKDEHNVAAVT
jgi:uncharacterized protein YxjI